MMPGKIEGGRRRGQQRMRWLDGITVLMDMSLSVAETSTRETKHHTQNVGELRFIKPAGPEELTLQALSTEQRVTEFLYMNRRR